MKPVPALSTWSSAAQKCFFLVLHNSLVPLMFQAGVCVCVCVTGGKEVSPAWGQPPKAAACSEGCWHRDQ